MRGFYRGILPTIGGSIPASCLYFTTYEFSKRHLQTDGASLFYVHFISGMLAETVSCVLWVPIDVIKERMQIQPIPRSESYTSMKQSAGDTFYVSGYDAMKSIYRHDGIAGFYRGYGATLASFGPFSALYFTFYENLKHRAMNLFPTTTKQPFGIYLACGAIAGAAASWCTNPLDIIKLRLQVQRANPSKTELVRYRNTVHGLLSVMSHEGVSGLFRGVMARMAFHAPATAINMALFESIRLLVQ